MFDIAFNLPITCACLSFFIVAAVYNSPSIRYLILKSFSCGSICMSLALLSIPVFIILSTSSVILVLSLFPANVISVLTSPSNDFNTFFIFFSFF